MVNTTTVIISGIPQGVTEWTSSQSSTGVVKAEASGLVQHLTEVTLAETGGTNTVTITLRKKDGAGAILFVLTLAAGGAVHIRFAKWRIGDAYDGSLLGNIHVVVTGSGTLSAFWIGHSV